MLLFDHSLKVEYGMRKTALSTGINIITNSRKLKIKAYSLWQMYDILRALQESIKNCPYIKLNRFISFAPNHPSSSYCKWFIDAQGYFSEIYEDLNKAKEDVYITDWWLSPELYLKRPVSESINQESRLDRVLNKIASNGIRIHIIVYKEVSFVLANNSLHTHKYLESLNSNIKVLRHPPDFISFWSHHEKMIIIDQEIGYLGGLDLCFGRMDNNKHVLADTEEEEAFFPGIDYSNSRISDFINVKNFEKSLIDRKTTPRLPWHDIAIKVIGDPVKDMVRHFIQYWNFARLDTDRKHEKTLVDINKKKTAKKPKTALKKFGKNFSYYIKDKLKHVEESLPIKILPKGKILNLKASWKDFDSDREMMQNTDWKLKAVTEEDDANENERKLDYYLNQKSIKENSGIETLGKFSIEGIEENLGKNLPNSYFKKFYANNSENEDFKGFFANNTNNEEEIKQENNDSIEEKEFVFKKKKKIIVLFF